MNERELKERQSKWDIADRFISSTARSMIDALPEKDREGVTDEYLTGAIYKEMYPQIGQALGITQASSIAKLLNAEVQPSKLPEYLYNQFALSRAQQKQSRIYNEIADEVLGVPPPDNRGTSYGYGRYTEPASMPKHDPTMSYNRGKPPEPKDRDKVLAELQERINLHSAHFTEGKVAEVLGMAVSSVGLLGEGMAAGAAGAVINPALGYAAAASANFPVYRGLLYKQMIDSGIEPKTAAKISLAGAA
ncbi:MAG: hypothetical protein LBD20_00840, partial [Spirochaetaceae bacterium]|nr:hypothetical protein [Spirochaetaceae bacterium]